jgi:hypothetical protein
MKKFFCHEKNVVRFIALLALSAVLFLIFWTASYYWLPEGIFRGKTGSAIVGTDAADTFLSEFLRIAAYNLIMGMGLIIAANWILKVDCFPLGYLIPLYYVILYALFLGTNSFGIPLAGKMAPSLAVLGRSGVYEITAFLLMASSTYHISAYRIVQAVPPQSEAISPAPVFWKAVDWTGFIIAAAVLVSANAWEAYRIVNL